VRLRSEYVARVPKVHYGVAGSKDPVTLHTTTEGYSMATYTFRFNEVSMNQVWFEADSDAHARELMRQAENDEINISDLPNAQERNRGIELDFSVSTLVNDDDGKPVCIHPKDDMVHEFDENSRLGDAYYCGLCGDLLQVG